MGWWSLTAAAAILLAGCGDGRAPEGGGGILAPGTAPPTPPATYVPPVTTPVPRTPLNPTSPDADVGAHTVVFAIGGTVRRTAITITVPGGHRQRILVSPPWRRTFTVRDGETLGLRARSVARGTLSCVLKVDGEPVKSSTSSSDATMDTDCGDTIGF